MCVRVRVRMYVCVCVCVHVYIVHYMFMICPPFQIECKDEREAHKACTEVE